MFDIDEDIFPITALVCGAFIICWSAWLGVTSTENKEFAAVGLTAGVGVVSVGGTAHQANRKAPQRRTPSK